VNTFDGVVGGFKRRSGELSFLDRLDDLRGRLIRSALLVVVTTIVGFVLAMRYPAVLNFAVAPVVPYLQGQKLKYLSPTDPFFITLKLGLCIGLTLAFPYLITQAWGLVAPLLDPREKRLIRAAIGASFVLFATGLAFCYYLALPLMLRFTMGFQTESLEQLIVIGEYLKLVLRSMFAFGVAFELPIVILVLTALDVVTPAFLAAKRRHAIAVITIVSAVLTPPDVSSLILLALPVWILYELSIVLSRAVVSRRAPIIAVQEV
jgi:sec-independent protein translocase protein TatC